MRYERALRCVELRHGPPVLYSNHKQDFTVQLGRNHNQPDEGMEGLFNCLTDIINNSQKPLSLKNLKFICHTPARAKDIIFRVEVVFNTLVKLFSKQHQNHSPRYILPGGTSFYVFQSVNKVLSYKEMTTKKQLLNELASPQEQFSPIHFDPAVLENTPIHLIYSINKPQVIQLFYYESKADTQRLYC